MSEISDLSSFGFKHISKEVSRSIRIVSKGKSGERKVYPTAFLKFNRQLLGGWQPGKLYVIGGRPGSGKSALSNQLIFDTLDHKKNLDKLIVLYWSFEMPGYQHILRTASFKTKKSMSELLSVDTELADTHFSEFCKAVSDYKNYPIYFNNRAGTVDHVMKICRRISALNPNKTILNLFDHSRLFKGNEDNELKRLTHLSHECIHLGLDTGCINIVISQLNREIEKEHRAADQYKPLLSDLFGADSIGQDAHVVMIINRPFDMYGLTQPYNGLDPKGLLALHIVKNRDGHLGMIPFDADLKNFTIKERI